MSRPDNVFDLPARSHPPEAATTPSVGDDDGVQRIAANVDRGAGLAFETVAAVASHARRIVGLAGSAARGIAQEMGDVVWDVRDVARRAGKSRRR